MCKRKLLKWMKVSISLIQSSFSIIMEALKFVLPSKHLNSKKIVWLFLSCSYVITLSYILAMRHEQALVSVFASRPSSLLPCNRDYVFLLTFVLLCSKRWWLRWWWWWWWRRWCPSSIFVLFHSLILLVT
jgi:hypothetical protein